MNKPAITRIPTFGPCVRCGRIAAHLESHPRALLVVHRDGFTPCPVAAGEMPIPENFPGNRQART
ncbi:MULTISPECIES: hypothetical protein [Amycolatopsis]|uniref:Uncharacterized protein n=1 Tax=Amycolatopsis saalfeldensis TaxID=394193 RepID=A0A1H8YQN3_9PSEU|nr:MULTISPECIES: hypothetical protein [Amycolatopsis]SEP54439.1 hypothetical protein SAMN04489732_14715 [Amycolatopsis saalfeldensis]